MLGVTDLDMWEADTKVQRPAVPVEDVTEESETQECSPSEE